MIRLGIFVIGMFITWYMCSNQTNKSVVQANDVQCGTKFCVNDCVASIVSRDREEWEGPRTVQKIVGVGRNAYRTIFWLDTYWPNPDRHSQTFHFVWEEAYEKVQCPE